MYKRVDEEEEKPEIDGFSYVSSEGDLEAVRLDGHIVMFVYPPAQPMSIIYVKDIPKMIKALAAAYEHETGEKVI